MMRARIAQGLSLALMFALPALALAQAAVQMSVTVKEAPARDRPSFTGKVVGTLAYGDRVTVEEVKGDWVRVSYAPRRISSAWLPKTTLQTQEIALRAGDKAVGSAASSGEVALAGKGFNAEVEAEYRKDRRLNYAAVDGMEAFRVSAEEVARFVVEGGLTVEGGSP